MLSAKPLGSVGSVRRLLLLLSAVVTVDTVFFTALTPLLPHFASHYGLGKGGAGGLAAAYAAGVLTASVPGGLAATRFGPKQAVVFGVLVTALTTLGFALATNVEELVAARVAQGIGSAFSWAGALAWLVAAGPPGRRGTLIGTVMGSAVFGAIIGPAVGALATVAGIRPTFLAVGCVGAVIWVFLLRMPGSPARPQPLSALRRADARLLIAIWLVILPALLFGVMDVLVPLRLHALGWGGAAIGGLFFAGAVLETALNPLLGRLTDRAGLARPVRYAIVGSIVVSVVLAWARTGPLIAVLVVTSAVAYGGLYTPGMALLSQTAEEREIAQGLAFGVMNLGWSAGAVVGPAAGGALGAAAGDAVPYLLLAGLCLATLGYAQSSLRPRSS
jgi:MFS family permease